VNKIKAKTAAVTSEYMSPQLYIYGKNLSRENKYMHNCKYKMHKMTNILVGDMPYTTLSI